MVDNLSLLSLFACLRVCFAVCRLCRSPTQKLLHGINRLDIVPSIYRVEGPTSVLKTKLFGQLNLFLFVVWQYRRLAFYSAMQLAGVSARRHDMITRPDPSPDHSTSTSTTTIHSPDCLQYASTASYADAVDAPACQRSSSSSRSWQNHSTPGIW